MINPLCIASREHFRVIMDALLNFLASLERLIAFPQGSSTSLGHILALMKPMGMFLWIFFFNYYFKEGHCIPAFVSGILLSPESRTYFDHCVCLVGSWARLFAWGYGCSQCLRIESLCTGRLVCWGLCQGMAVPANPQSCDGPLAGPVPSALSKQPDLSCAPIAGCLSSPAMGEWFQHRHPRSSGTGLWPLGKAGFFFRSGLLPVWCIPFNSQWS